MNTTLNINRLGLLLKRYFLENKQRELTFWGITMVVFTLMHLAGAQDKFISVEIYLFISGFIFAAGTFKAFNFTPSGMHYLLIPATHLEKLVTAIILSTFYFFVCTLITYTIGTALGTTIGNIFLDMHNPIQFTLFQSTPDFIVNGHSIHKAGNALLNTFIGFAGVQSVFMLGSIYFKGNAIGKTMLAIIAVSIVLGIIEVFLLKATFGTYHLNGQMLNLSITPEHNMFAGAETVGTIIKYALIPFFWVVTYFRLTEKEV